MAEPRYITEEEFLRFRTAVVKKLRKMDALISDAFQAIADGDDNARELAEEASNHAQRAERAVRRLKKEFDALEVAE